MPIDSKYDQAKGMLLITLEGDVLLDELDLLYRDIVNSEEFPPDIRSIWDFRKADLTLIDKPFIKQVFAVRKRYPERGNARAAFVADKDHPFGMTRMYEVLSSFELPQQIMAFREYAEAEEWILAGK